MENSKSQIHALYIIPVACVLLMIVEYLGVVAPDTLPSNDLVRDWIAPIAFENIVEIQIIFVITQIVAFIFNPVSDMVGTEKENGFTKNKARTLILFVCCVASIIVSKYVYNYMLYMILYPLSVLGFEVFGYIIRNIFLRKRRLIKTDFGFKYNSVKTNGPYDFHWFSEKWGHLNIEAFARHIWIIGGPGAGKTSRLINKIISDSIKNGFALLIFDFKMNANLETNPRKWALTRYAYGVMRLYSTPAKKDINGKWIGEHSINNDRRKFWIINLRDPRYSHQINPFLPEYIETEAYAHEYAATLLQNLNPQWVKNKDFFAEASIAYYKPIVWFTKIMSEEAADKEKGIMKDLERKIASLNMELDDLVRSRNEYVAKNLPYEVNRCNIEIEVLSNSINSFNKEKEFLGMESQICTIPHTIAIALQDVNRVLAALSNNRDCALMVESLKKAVVEKAGGQIAGVIATIQNLLIKLADPRLTWVLSNNTPGLSLKINDPENPSVFCFGSDPEMKEVFSPIAALIGKIASKVMNQPGRLPSENIYDEMPQININNLHDTLSTCRSNDMGFTIAGQDDNMYELIYTKEQAAALKAQCSNVFIGQVNHKETAKGYSEYIGQREKENVSISSGASMGEGMSRNKGENIGTQDKYLIQPHELETLNTGEFVGKVAEVNKDTPYDYWFRTQLDVYKEPIEDIPFPQLYTKPEGVEFTLKDMEKMMKDYNENMRDSMRDYIDLAARQACASGLFEEHIVFPSHFNKDGVRVVDTYGRFLYDGMKNYNRFTGLYEGAPNMRVKLFDNAGAKQTAAA